ncbi:MAG: permease, partial [Methanopyri archaeon]|nr:permease [Methanopyri archaeon]
LCSCGVIPAVAELRNKGASKSASLAFLISVPETGVDSIALSWTLLDPVLTIARPVVAFVTATITGLVSNAVDPEEVHEVSTDETCIHCGDCLLCNPHDHTITEKVRSAFEYGFGELLGDLAPSLAVGIILAGVIAYLVPEDVLGAYIGSGFHSLVIMLLVGIPLYICATSSTPVVASLIAKGMSPGAGLVFLLAGPTTNMATIAVVRSRFGTRSVVIYLTSIAICSLGAGMLVDGYYTSAGLDPRTTIGNAGELFPHNVEVGAAIVLIILLARGVYLQYTKGPPCDDVCCSTEVKPTCTHDTDDANDHHEKGSCEHDHEGHEH